MNKRKIILLVIVSLACIIGLGGCASKKIGVSETETWLLSAEELESWQMMVHNSRSSSTSELRSVDDSEFVRQVLELYAKAETFRPYMPSLEDSFGSSSNNVFCTFRTEREAYSIMFVHASEQIELDYIHRDAPVILVTKAVADNNTPHGSVFYSRESAWYCTMDPADYATLHELLYLYGGGEIIQE